MAVLWTALPPLPIATKRAVRWTAYERPHRYKYGGPLDRLRDTPSDIYKYGGPLDRDYPGGDRVSGVVFFDLC
ncbi:MAG: hypothetical protein IPL65_05075 [Lewinellaceae bacterium]|nr:hypothetical protein [Lewinellaceae bacterium]